MTTIDKSVKRLLDRRATLLTPGNKTVPSHHEAMSNLGNFLGETVLNEMSPMAKEMMRIDRPFPVAPKTIWLSPSDKINRNIMLTPPPNDDVIKALTHEGILEIGSSVEEKLEKHFQARIKAAKKEVEDFERFECNNRIKFALQQEKLAHDSAMKEQRLDLLKMFQRDREELIEESKTELETVTKKLTNDLELKRKREVQMSVEQTELSANQRIIKLTESLSLVESELEDTRKLVNVEVEKRKCQDWQILHEIFIEMHRQFTTKLTILHNQHNAEMRQLFLEVKGQSVDVDIEQTTTLSDELWDDDSMTSGIEQEKIEFNGDGKPFLINVCKVEGESSEDDKSSTCHSHSSGSSFKCHKHRSRPKSDIEQGSFDAQILYDVSPRRAIPDLNEINTTDVSCNILRRLGLNFNMANIEKVKVELDNLLVNIKKGGGGEAKLLTTIDSLDLFNYATTANFDILNSKESIQKQDPDPDREEYRRIMNRRKWKTLEDTKLAIPLTIDEYLDTLIPVPKYMETNNANISIWDYKAMNDEEWNKLLEELDATLQSESNETDSKSKSVTVTSPNSMVSLESRKIVSNNRKKPGRGILRPSVEHKIDTEFLNNEVFQTHHMQSLVKKLCDE